MAKRKKRLRWMRRLKNKLVGVCLSDRHKGYAGFRVARILRAQFDRKTKQVVRVVVRCYGNDEHKNNGYNGHIFDLDNRREFTGVCRGIVENKQYLPIDEYAVEIYRRKESTVEQDAEALVPADEATETPPFAEDQRWLNLEQSEMRGLQQLLIRKPQLLKQVLPMEPYWTMKLPDKGTVELFGYGYASKGRPIKAEVMMLVSWQPAGSKTTFAVGTSAEPKLTKQLRQLLKVNMKNVKTAEPEPEPELEPGQEFEPSTDPPVPEPVAGDDDYF